jgi:hypothetical protein
MRKLIFLLLVLSLFFLLSCSKGEKTKEKIIRSTAEKMELPDKVKVTLDLKKIREGIIHYNNLNEQNPSTIEELNLELYYPDDYTYDSQKGTVKSKSYPDF